MSAGVADSLALATDRLERSWQDDVLPLLLTQRIYGEIGEILAAEGTTGLIIMRRWYPDFVLASCRRIWSADADEVGIRQALIIIRRVAGDVTVESIVEHQRTTGPVSDDYLPLIQHNFDALIAESGGDTPATHLGRRTVQHDLDRIDTTLERMERIATSVVAHRLDGPKAADPVTQDELNVLLDELTRTYRRWSLILRGADVDTSIDHLVRAHRIAHALTLHDERALARAFLESGSAEGRPRPPTLEDLDRVEVAYRVNPPSADGSGKPASGGAG